MSVCKQPVIVNKANYELFEKMHWLCFHIVFEHHADPDTKCDDPSCPWWHIEILKEKLNHLNIDANDVIQYAPNKQYGLIYKGGLARMALT